MNHRFNRDTALGVLDMSDPSTKLDARVLARADEEGLGDEDVAAREGVDEIREEGDVRGGQIEEIEPMGLRR